MPCTGCERSRRRAPVEALFAGVLVAVTAADGEYFRSSLSWTALVFLWAAAAILVLGGAIFYDRLGLWWIAAAAAFTGVGALSALWSPTPGDPLDELLRNSLYVAAAACAVLVPRSMMNAGKLLGGVLAAGALVSAYALGTRFFPERSPVTPSRATWQEP